MFFSMHKYTDLTANTKQEEEVFQSFLSKNVLYSCLRKEEILIIEAVTMVAFPYITAVKFQSEILIEIPVYAE